MMRILLAGIDEAGLGPTLGPLATGSAALETPSDWNMDEPWRALERAVCASWKKSESRLGVADSKILYTAGGPACLEATVAVFSALANSEASLLPVRFAGASEAHPCYSLDIAPFPHYCTEEQLSPAAALLRAACDDAGARPVHLEAALLFEPAFNRRVADGQNKNQVLLGETGRHLRCLAEKFPEHAIKATVDKQGGRNDYLPFLTSLFPGAWIETLSAGADRSEYRIKRKGGVLEITFAAKGDRFSFTTALASLVAKYVRERAVKEMNAWFCARLPGLKPTAGYPADARRWLAETRKREGNARDKDALYTELLIRTR